MSENGDGGTKSREGIMARADALLKRRRSRADPVPQPASNPGAAEPADAAGIPVLTDIVPDPELMKDGGDPQSPASSVEVISRVQNQNLQHSMKLTTELDSRIAAVVLEQFLPEIGTALDSAVQHIT